MENQTHAQNQRVPVIQVSGLKKQYKLGQIGGGTLTHDLQSWWARVRGKEDPNTVIGTDQRLFGQPDGGGRGHGDVYCQTHQTSGHQNDPPGLWPARRLES